jgi:hypothetical protein
MSNNTILMALERMGYKGTMTGHGFRGLASTILHEQGYGHDHMLFAPFLELAASARSGTSWISGDDPDRLCLQPPSHGVGRHCPPRF